MPMQRVVLSLPADLLTRIDGARGDTPRAAWLRRAAEIRLGPEAYLPLNPRPATRPWEQIRRDVEPRFKK